MKKIISLLVLIALIIIAAVAFGADAALVAAPAAAPIAQGVSILEWFKQNASVVLACALAVSELLGATPWFKGNGLLDSIIKSLKYLASKDSTPAT